jgi:hypothetical protein
MKAKGKLVWLALLLARNVFIYAVDKAALNDAEYQESSDYQFITLILHGWSEAIAGTGIKDGFYEPEAGGFLIDKERAGYEGMIYDRSGTSVANADILFNNRQVGKSDFNGRFYIPRVIPGEHQLRVRKTGYESYFGIIITRSPMDIAYVSLVSKEDLCVMIQNALRERHWDLADTYTKRALAVDSRDMVIRFLAATVQAIPARQSRNVPEAVALLEGLLNDGFREPVILLFLADLYEYDLNDNENSQKYLSQYIHIKDDEIVKERLKRVQNALEER